EIDRERGHLAVVDSVRRRADEARSAVALDVDERDDDLPKPAVLHKPVDAELRGLDERIAREQRLDEGELARRHVATGVRRRRDGYGTVYGEHRAAQLGLFARRRRGTRAPGTPSAASRALSAAFSATTASCDAASIAAGFATGATVPTASEYFRYVS